jgi:hypothetical protein
MVMKPAQYLKVSARAENLGHRARYQDDVRRRVGLHLLDRGSKPVKHILPDGVLGLRPVQPELHDPCRQLNSSKTEFPKREADIFFSRRRDGGASTRTDGRTRVRGRELLQADRARLGDDLKCANEDGAVGGGRGCRPQRVAAGEVAGYGQEAPETAHSGWIGDERVERQVRREPDRTGRLMTRQRRGEMGGDRETR